MSQALYRKWRPRLWDQVIGQEHVVKTLQNAIRGDRVGHAYLFSGPRGTGKTTTARLLAKAVNCLSEDPTRRPCDECDNCRAVNENRMLDLIEIDAASNTSVDDMRDLRDKINFAPSQGRFKIYIIDEVHMLSTAAFNALLKTLEEPPPHAIFILATTEIHKIPATVLSRCQRHEFRRIPVAEIAACLRQLSDNEKIDADDDALTLIARQSTGSMRDAISLLDQLASTGEPVTLALAQTVLGTAALQAVVDLVDTLIAEDPAAGLQVIHNALDSGSDARQLARQMVDYLRNLLQVRVGNKDAVEATIENRDIMVRQAEKFSTPRLVETIKLFNTAAGEARSTWNPGLHLELAVISAIEAAHPPVIEPAQAAPEVNLRDMKMPSFQAPSHPPSRHAESSQETPNAAEYSAAPVKEPVKQVLSEPAVQVARANSISPEAASQNPAAVPVSGTITMDELRKAWPQIRMTVKKAKAQTEALLNSVRNISIEGDRLILSFASDIVKQKMEMDDNMEMTRRAIYHVTKANLQIVCNVGSAKTSAPGNTEIPREGLVNTAINLGGQIKKQ
ncbi:DNA polymerase III subunit gamma/tau [Leptolinea sp. HRD-7]|nr:DNA polymerase III subunit gamma/tau [Leptolinea sp. HRD-7]